MSTGQKPVEERQEDVLDNMVLVLVNMVLVLVWRYWAILAGGEKAVPARSGIQGSVQSRM